MTLGQKRRRFTVMLAKLLIYTDSIGYGVAVDYVKRCKDCPVGHPKSVHKAALAADLNLYWQGSYLTSGKHHIKLHDYWDAMGGAERIERDMNHYSIEHRGVR